MGRDLMSRPPKFVHRFLDRHGTPRFYFRRPGFARVALPGLPWSPEFMAAYQEAMNGERREVRIVGVKSGSIGELTAKYLGSARFLGMKPTTQGVYRNILNRFCEETDKSDKKEKFRDKPAAMIQREHIVKLMAARADKPESANGLRKALRALMQYAVEIGVRADDPTRDVKAIRVQTTGYHSWTDEEIAAFEAHHPEDSRPRLALALLLYTGQRRSDVVRMGRQHLRDGGLFVRQQKTGVELEIPVLAELEPFLARAAGRLTFLVTEQGKPFTAAGFGNWFRERCDQAGLTHCTAHGLRKAAARRLAEGGCTAHEIAAITGHASLREVERYTRAVDQKRLARAAMNKLSTGGGKPTARVATEGK